MQYFHGICAVTGRPFTPPVEIRVVYIAVDITSKAGNREPPEWVERDLSERPSVGRFSDDVARMGTPPSTPGVLGGGGEHSAQMPPGVFDECSSMSLPGVQTPLSMSNVSVPSSPAQNLMQSVNPTSSASLNMAMLTPHDPPQPQPHNSCPPLVITNAACCPLQPLVTRPPTAQAAYSVSVLVEGLCHVCREWQTCSVKRRKTPSGLLGPVYKGAGVNPFLPEFEQVAVPGIAGSSGETSFKVIAVAARLVGQTVKGDMKRVPSEARDAYTEDGVTLLWFKHAYKCHAKS
jgi:hypothetical protein